MNKGISFYFGYDIKPQIRAKMIKNAGFDCVITNADKRFNKQNGRIGKQVSLFKKYGLKLSSLHMVYKTDELPYFWKEGKLGQKLKRNLIKDVKTAHKYGFSCVVVHLMGEFSQVGLQRIKEVLKICEKLKIPLALENLNDNRELLLQIYKNIDNQYLKFCYDSGHNNVFDREVDYLKDFGDILQTLHLHDNDGKKDLHTISKIVSTVDWDRIAKRLQKHEDLSLDFELLNRKENNLTADEYLNEAYKQACGLEKKISSHEKKLSRKNVSKNGKKAG